jgi:hypothetical protein
MAARLCAPHRRCTAINGSAPYSIRIKTVRLGIPHVGGPAQALIVLAAIANEIHLRARGLRDAEKVP